MRRFFTIIMALLLAVPTFSQQKSDTMYVHMNDGSMKRIAVVAVDSVTFSSPSDAAPDHSPAEAIDLGLSVKWASCNVGATSPEDYGGYYAWGETEEKSEYSWETYKWCNGSDDTLTKYCTDSNYGTVDNKTVLEPEDDVAHVKWGGAWRMPTRGEQQELVDKCSWSWTEINGVNGYKVTAPNGNSIFLPAAGYRYGTKVGNIGSDGSYWSASLRDYENNGASNLDIYTFYHTNYMFRFYGFSVRPVQSPQSDTMYIHQTDGTLQRIAIAMVDSVTFVSPSVDTPDTPSDSTSVPAEAIDLGLSVKWASCNVGAKSPEDYGDYYAWGETEEKSDYSWKTYKWCNGSYDTLTKYCTDSKYGTVDNKTVLEPEDDVAHVKWGGGWRMPTIKEQQELLEKCSWSWTEINSVIGYKVTGPNGNSIFLPHAGCRSGTEVNNRDSDEGYYWSASLFDGRSFLAYYLFFYYDYYQSWTDTFRYIGYSVRPVCDK